MANVVVSYLKEEQTLVEDINGILLNEAYIVSNLAPGRRMLYDALFAAGVPNYNDPHEVSDLFCIKKVPKVFAKTSNTEAKVICTFGPSDFSNVVSPIIRYHGYTVEVDTNFRYDGNPILVNYTDYSAGAGTPFPTEIGLVRGTKEKGLLTVDFIADSDPGYLTDYENCLNASAWRGKAAYTWLCCEVNIDKVLYRPGWRVGLAFEYDSETHIHTAPYRLVGGIIPKDIDPVVKTASFGNGWTNAQTNPTADFNGLSIPNGF